MLPNKKPYRNIADILCAYLHPKLYTIEEQPGLFCHTQQGQRPSILLACVMLPAGNKVWARSQMWQIPKITSWALTLLTIKWYKDDLKSSKRQLMARHLDFLIFKRKLYNETMEFYSRKPRWSLIPWMEKIAMAEMIPSCIFILR